MPHTERKSGIERVSIPKQALLITTF